MTVDGKADIRYGDIGQRRASKLRPIGAIRGTVSGECAATPHELDPVRGAAAGRVVVAAPTVARTVLPGHAVARRHSIERVGRAGIQAVTDHHPGFRPAINVL